MLEWFNFTYLFLSFTHLTGAVYLPLASTLELVTKAEGSQNELKLSGIFCTKAQKPWEQEWRGWGAGHAWPGNKGLISVSSLDFVAAGLDFSNIIYFVQHTSATYIDSITSFSVCIIYNMDFWFSVISERSFFVRYQGPGNTTFHSIPKIFDTCSRWLILPNSIKLFSVIIYHFCILI